MFHILLAHPGDQTDSVLLLLLCLIADMYLVELLDQVVLHYVVLQGFVVGASAVWDFAVQSPRGWANDLCWSFAN